MSLTSAPWRPAAAFTDPGGAELGALVARPRRQWGAAPHAAAALAWKVYAWWCLDPVVRALREGRPVPRLDLDNTEVSLLDDSPYVGFRTVDPRPVSGPDVLEQVGAGVLDGHLGRVADALAVATRVGVRTLWGSVAESVSYPLLAADRADLAERVLDAWSLRGLLEAPFPLAGQPARLTCCLAVTVPGLGICDTCPVTRRQVSVGAGSLASCSS